MEFFDEPPSMDIDKIKERLNNHDYFANKIAAGLRRMNRKPDALLYFDKEDSFYDKHEIFLIPVYRTTFIYQGNGQEEIRFYPLFKDPHFDSTIEVTNFRKGYEEW